MKNQTNNCLLKEYYNNLIMQKGSPSDQQQENIEKRRRSHSKYDKNLARYECFCAKQYLSYPALYLHMKNKHLDYFQNTKTGKKVEPTKLIESYNHAEGFKVYKIAMDSNLLDIDKKDLFSGKIYAQNFIENSKSNYYINQAGGYLGYQNIPYHQQNYGYMVPENHLSGGQRKPEQRQSTIQMALSMFMHTLKEKPSKRRYQIELFFTLLVDCLNKNYEQLKDTRTESKQVKRYTAEYNCEKIMSIFPYFKNIYLPNYTQESDPCTFFIKHSHIITSGEYKTVLEQFYDDHFSKKANPVLRNLIQAKQLHPSSNQAPSQEKQNNSVQSQYDGDSENEVEQS